MKNKAVLGKENCLPALAVIGIALGLISVVSAGTLFDLFLCALIAYAIYKYSPSDEKDFLIKLFISGVVLRILLLVLIQSMLMHNGRWFESYGDKAVYLFGDEGYYTIRSWWITQYVSGLDLGASKFNNAFGFYGQSFYLYIVAFFYYLFGYSPVSVVFLNIIFGVLTGIVYYFIGLEIAGRNAARVAAIVTVFFPSLVIWSISNLKDPLFIFLMGIILLSFVKLVKNNRLRYIWPIFIALLLQLLVRPKTYLYIMAVMTWVIASYLMIRKKIRLSHMILLIMILIVLLPALYPKFESVKIALVNQQKAAASGGIHYRIYDDWVYHNFADVSKVTNFQLLKALFKGWVHFFLEPFIWKTRSFASLSVFPQMVVWYFIVLFGFLGLFAKLKQNDGVAVSLIVFLLLVGSIFAMTGGNIGTTFRMRDMLTPLIILFSSIGISDHLQVRQDKGRI